MTPNQRGSKAFHFDYEAMSNVYLKGKWAAKSEIDVLINNTSTVRSLGIEGINWLPIDQAVGQFRDVPISVHYEAMAGALGFSFNGIEDFYRQHIQAGILPPHILNRTQFFEPPDALKNLKIGKLLVRLGLLSSNLLAQGLGIQQMMESETGARPFLSMIINKIGQLSAPDFYQTLGYQAGIDYVSLNDSADAIVNAVRLRHKKEKD